MEGRIQSIEGVRGFAALLVFFVHFHALFGGGPFFQFASTVGRSGVNLLFLISGYLIYRGLLHKPSGYGRYLYHRVKRIYPAFFCVFAAYVLFRLTVLPNGDLSGVYLLQNLALLPGLIQIKPLITVSWSLSYQMFFYCAIPILIGITGMRRWTSAFRCYFFIALAVAYALLHLKYATFSIPWLRFYPAAHPRMLMFVAGILVYEVQSRGVPSNAVRKLMTVAAPVGLMSYYLLQTNPWMLANLRTAICSAAVLAVGYFCLALNSFTSSGFLSRAFSWAPLRFVGKLSYSFYLTQGLALQGLRFVLPPLPVPALLPIAVGASLIASSLLFELVERPLSIAKKEGRAI